LRHKRPFGTSPEAVNRRSIRVARVRPSTSSREPHRLSALGEIGQEFAQFSVEFGGVHDCQVQAKAPISTLDSDHDVTRIDHGRSDEVRGDSHTDHGPIDSIETGRDRWGYGSVGVHCEQLDSYK
jgi:hypothetical protein